MKYIFAIAGVIILGVAVQSFMPWWSVAIVAAIMGASFKLNNLQSYLIGFLGVFLLWGSYAALINHSNESILATKVGVIFGGLGAFQLVLVTALLGGIIGGFGALTGRLGRNFLKP